MSKRGYWLVFGIIGILIAGFAVGFGVYQWINHSKGIDNSQSIAREEVTDDCIEEAELYDLSLLDGGETEDVNAADEKISPNAEFKIRKNYKKCEHTTEEYAELPQELVNMTKDELEKQYPDFIIEKFSSSYVVLYKEMEGICAEHYVLKEQEGVIAIYTVDEKEKETLYEKTGVSVEYLPQSDQENLKKGIRIYGKEQLNITLEDFE